VLTKMLIASERLSAISVGVVSTVLANEDKLELTYVQNTIVAKWDEELGLHALIN